MTGSRLQLYNGLLLLGSFFSCRLVWGTYQSIRVAQDVWAALHYPHEVSAAYNSTGAVFGALNSTAAMAANQTLLDNSVMRFASPHPPPIPVWLAFTYLGSNVTLNALNF